MFLQPIYRYSPGETKPLYPVPENTATLISRGVYNGDVAIGDQFLFTFMVAEIPFTRKDSFVADVKKQIEQAGSHYRVDDIYYDEAEDRLKALLTVVDNPLPFLVVFGAVVGGIAALLLMFGVQLEKVEKVVDNPVMAGTIQTGGIFLAGVIALGIIIGLKTLFK